MQSAVRGCYGEGSKRGVVRPVDGEQKVMPYLVGASGCSAQLHGQQVQNDGSYRCRGLGLSLSVTSFLASLASAGIRIGRP